MRGKRAAAMATAILLFFVLFGGSAQGRETIYLRVIGRDDTPAGQAEKIRVRDAVLAACPAAWTDPNQLIAAADRAAKAVAECRTEVRIWQPAGGVPARTLYVTVGAGQGHNWWGILYGDAAALTAEDGEGEEITVTWSLWDWLRGLLGL